LRRFAAKTTVAASSIAHASCVTIDSEQETRKNSKTSCQLQQKDKRIYKRSQLEVLVRMFIDYLVSCNLFGDVMKMATQTKGMQVDFHTVFVPTTYIESTCPLMRRF